MEIKRRRVAVVLLAFLLVLMSAVPAFAEGAAELTFTADNGNMAVIHDTAGLLGEGEKERLLENMKHVTEYGHAAFVTVSENHDTAETYAKSRYNSLFGSQSGTLFLIDMDNRRIQFYSDGRFAKLINSAKSNEMADNIYQYASGEKYFECAKEAFNQVLIILKGGRISTPMRHVTNALIAVCLGLLLNFLFVAVNRRRKVSIREIDREQVIEGSGFSERTDFIRGIKVTMTSETRSRRSSSSSGGGGGGSSGGGGGGGGESSGGGGGGGGSSGGHAF